MKKGLTIQEMAKEIMRQRDAKADYLVNTERLRMEACDAAPTLHVVDNAGFEMMEPLSIQRTAHRQISSYLNIPQKYYEKMLGENPELLAINVNSWLHRKPEQRMLRTIDGRARAFLSNRYRPIDNFDIASITLPIIGEMPDAWYESCQITEDNMYIKVVNPRLTEEVVPGDIVQAGVVISNSETGLGAVCVQPLVFRLVCSNGMVVNEAGTRRNHVGRANSTEENFSIYSQETLAAIDNAFIKKLCVRPLHRFCTAAHIVMKAVYFLHRPLELAVQYMPDCKVTVGFHPALFPNDFPKKNHAGSQIRYR